MELSFELRRIVFFLYIVGVLSRAYGGGSGHHSVPSHNDLPVPQGDWQEHYQKTQARYNTQLAASVVLLGGIIAYVSGLQIPIFINLRLLKFKHFIHFNTD